MKGIFIILFIWTCALPLKSQSDTTYATPIQGLEKLYLRALGIEFTPEHRAKLNGASIEFIFNVDIFGIGTLKEINGVRDSIVLDSFFSIYKPYVLFKPMMIDSTPIQSYYFYKVNYPAYTDNKNLRTFQTNRFSFNNLSIEDFESIELSKNREEFGLSGFFISPLGGDLSQYLGIGGGLECNVTYLFPHYLVGINVNVADLNRQKEWPNLNTVREHAKYPSILNLNFYTGIQNGNSSSQMEVGISKMNLLFNLDNTTKDGISTQGYNIALSYGYKIPVSKSRTIFYSNGYYLSKYLMQVTGKARVYRYSFTPANGLSLELGLSILNQFQKIKKFKLKK
jgi:hypothetical protein